MSSHRFTPEFKEEGVRLVVERGYGVQEVPARFARYFAKDLREFPLREQAPP